MSDKTKVEQIIDEIRGYEETIENVNAAIADAERELLDHVDEIEEAEK